MITISVDDKLTIAKETAKLMTEIEPEGEHLAVKDPEEALKLIEEKHPEIVWLDIEMPKINGLEMAMKIKTISPQSNIVFVTGHSEYALDAHQLHVSGFVLKPASVEKLQAEIDNLRTPMVPRRKSRLSVQCFGNFEAFNEKGEPIHFSRQKAKETLAYLVDRRGAGVSVNELCTALWEEREADTGLKAQCRALLRSLKLDLRKEGVEDVIRKDWNSWSVDQSKIDCDYYDFLKGSPAAVNLFQGEYMTQYYWAEMRIGNLYDMSEEYIETGKGGDW